MDRTKALDRAAKISALIASEADYGNEAAALNFGAALQRLMLEHDIEDADIEAHQKAGTTRVEAPIVEDDLKGYTFGVHEVGRRNAALEDLAMFVAKAHLCKILIRGGSNWIGLVGTQAHIDVTRIVIGTMWKSLNRMAKDGYRQAKRDGADLRGYNGAFKHAFVWKLQARYSEERQAVVAEQDAMQATRATERRRDACMDAGGDTTTDTNPEPSQALAVINNELERVGAHIRAKYRGKGLRSIGNGGNYNKRASSDGSAAASRVPLRSNAVGGSGSRGQLGA